MRASIYDTCKRLGPALEWLMYPAAVLAAVFISAANPGHWGQLLDQLLK